MRTVLTVEGLCVSFPTAEGEELRALEEVSFTVAEGEIVGLVGESGCGKSMTARAIMRLLKSPGYISGGRIELAGRDLTALSEREMADVRGEEVSMIFQEPMTSLDPVMRVGQQVQETLRLHRRISRREARAEVLRMFERVGIADAARRYACYPHELSGGLRQRVMIAMAMICRPKLLIADEPTTALDVTVQAQILRLMRALREDSGSGMIFITHDLGVVAELCDCVCVMYGGTIVERAEVRELFASPRHPYTAALLRAHRSLEQKQTRLATLAGAVPPLSAKTSGCAFAPRCAHCTERCRRETPSLRESSSGHWVRCHREEV